MYSVFIKDTPIVNLKITDIVYNVRIQNKDIKLYRIDITS